MLLRLLVLVVRDLVITLSAIAYNVDNNLDEVLLAIVCTVYSGNIITRSRLVVKVAVTRAFVVLYYIHTYIHTYNFICFSTQVYWYREKLDCTLKEAEGQYPVLLHLSLKNVVFTVQVYWNFGAIGLFNFLA